MADDLVRRGPDADHRLGAADRRVRPAHLGAAVRGRDHRGRVHGLLRRVLPELPAGADPEGRPGRRERQARLDPVVRAGGRARSRRRPGRPGRCGRGDDRERDLLRRLGGVPAGHPGPRRAAAPGPAPDAAGRSPRRPEVRVQAPDPAQHRGVHGNREPVRRDGRRRGDHLPGPGPARQARRHRAADRRGQPRRRRRRGAVGQAEPSHRLGPHHLVLVARPRPPAARHPARPAGLAGRAVPDRLRGVLLQRRGVQRGAGQLPAGDLPPAAARADERGRPLGRLGHAPARRRPRRRAGHAAGRARHAVDRVRGQLGGRVVAVLLPAARAARHPRS